MTDKLFRKLSIVNDCMENAAWKTLREMAGIFYVSKYTAVLWQNSISIYRVEFCNAPPGGKVLIIL